MPEPETPSTDESTSVSYTGRYAEYWAPIEDEADVQAIAQRVAQNCLSALERDEADKVRVRVMEAQTDE